MTNYPAARSGHDSGEAEEGELVLNDTQRGAANSQIPGNANEEQYTSSHRKEDAERRPPSQWPVASVDGQHEKHRDRDRGRRSARDRSRSPSRSRRRRYYDREYGSRRSRSPRDGRDAERQYNDRRKRDRSEERSPPDYYHRENIDFQGREKAKVEEAKEEDEAFQERVMAALQAQEQDEELLIEERRRRRQQILAKYKQSETGGEARSKEQQTPAASGGPEKEGRIIAPSEAEALAEPDEAMVLEELGIEAGGALDIWRHDGVDAEGPRQQRMTKVASTVSVPLSGIGEADDEEHQQRLQATIAAQKRHEVELRDEGGGEEEEQEDIFAATPEDTANRAQKGTQATIDAGAVRRGLVDSYDDAEGYYNFQVGELVGGRYEVFKAHGRGVFSSVLRARDRGAVLGGDALPEVAIKVIRANETMYKAGQTEKVILRKLAEADPQGRRHCIRLLGSFDYRNHLCLVFEPMDMDLRALTKRYGRGIGLSLSAVRVYTQQMLVALHHLRNCGVLHADIKPDNILVNDRRTVVKLCDFGSAMFSGDNEITPYLVSRFYRAPEVILGLPYDHPMDMWSVGCVVYELFTGQILFPGKTNNEMLKLMMDVKGPFPKRMIKKAEFAYKHFESDANMSFALIEEDTVTKRPLRRLLPNPAIKADFAALLAGQDADRRKLVQLADLLERMMALDPDKRITPKDAINHPFVRGDAPHAARLMAPPRAVVAAGLK